MSHALPLPVLVVGAGPTGLTLACDLARRGIRVRIVDAAPGPFAGSRGKGLQPRTLEVLDDLGVLDAVLAAGTAYPRLRLHWRRFVVGRWTMMAHHAATPDEPHPNPWLVPQARTEGILRDRLASLGHAVEFGTALTGFTQDDAGVTATLGRCWPSGRGTRTRPRGPPHASATPCAPSPSAPRGPSMGPPARLRAQRRSCSTRVDMRTGPMT